MTGVIKGILVGGGGGGLRFSILGLFEKDNLEWAPEISK